MKKLNIKRILIPTDFSDTGLLAIEHGAHMARLYKAELFLLHVMEVPLLSYSAYDPFPMTRFVDEEEETFSEKLKALALKIKKEYDVQVVPLLNSGKASSGIADTAKDKQVDIILMGTHGASGFEEYFVGSNAHKTVTISPCPVITFQTKSNDVGFKNIVLPIDNTLHSRQKVNYVIELASKYKAKIHLVGLIDEGEGIDEKKFNIKVDAVEHAIKHSKLPYVRTVVKGKNIATEAMNYSDKVLADLIVIMADHESTIEGVFLGILSKQIINHAKIPVLSIRPEEGKYEALDLSASSNPFFD